MDLDVANLLFKDDCVTSVKKIIVKQAIISKIFPRKELNV